MELLLLDYVEGGDLEEMGFELPNPNVKTFYTKVSEEKNGITLSVMADLSSRCVWLAVDNSLVDLPKNEIYRNENIIYGAMEEDEVSDKMYFDLGFEFPSVIFDMWDKKLIKRKE